MRAIYADLLALDVLGLPNCENGYSDTYDKATILDLIDEQPTAGPKTGRWVKNDEGDYHCSVCNAIVEADERARHYWAYCYHCGANMEDGYGID